MDSPALIDIEHFNFRERIDKGRGFSVWSRVLPFVSRLVARYDMPTNIKLMADRPVLMCGNHRSLLDLAVALAVFRRFGVTCRVMVRADLVENGLAGVVLRSMGCIATSSERREQAEEGAVAALKSGQLVCMMPEGRIPRPEERTNGVGPVRPGLSRIATASGAQILPIGISRSDDAWPRGKAPRLQLRRPTVTIRCGDPLVLNGADDQANAQLVMEKVAELIVA